MAEILFGLVSVLLLRKCGVWIVWNRFIKLVAIMLFIVEVKNVKGGNINCTLEVP